MKKKKKRSMSSNARTKKHLTSLGWHCEIVERFNPHVGEFGKRLDMFGFIDIVAVNPYEKRIVWIQACGTDFQPHWRKMVTEATDEVRQVAIAFLEAGGQILLIGWRKVLEKKGGKRKVWKERVVEISLDDYRFTSDGK